MPCFLTSGHIVPWAGLCLGNSESVKAQVRKAKEEKLSAAFYADYLSQLCGRGCTVHADCNLFYVKKCAHFQELRVEYYNQFNPECKINAYLKKVKAFTYHKPPDYAATSMSK